ncbi:MAG: DUF4864 domain-containing protein [Candidatus Nanopelagicaceae bacterium]
MFKYRKQITLAIVLILILSLAASLFSGVIESSNQEVSTTACLEGETRAIQTLIQNQAFAFRAQDVTGAYAYFSDNFQGDVDKERFSLIVGTNYPMLLQGGGLAFGECRVISIGFAQAVTLTGSDRSHRLLYFVTEADGPLKVEGITVEE